MFSKIEVMLVLRLKSVRMFVEHLESVTVYSASLGYQCIVK